MLFSCNTHRFRATLATNLLNSGYDVETTGKLLGQKCFKSLGYYANVTNEKAKEQLKGRLEKDNLLISNIGKIDDKVLSDYKNPILYVMAGVLNRLHLEYAKRLTIV